MAQTPREVVTRGLKFDHPERLPRDFWLLPWAQMNLPDAVDEIQRRYPSDFAGAGGVYRPSGRVQGDPYELGLYVDEWGCIFTNIQAGAIGEVRTPLLPDISRWQEIEPPYETLPADWEAARGKVNQFCASTERFVLGGCCPRVWERYQFIRGSQNAMLDIALMEADTWSLLRRIHDFYLRELEFWVSTDVDGVNFMDDWGMQNRLLISPRTWQRVFKPFYRDYCELAHAHGKFIFMHSDGHILEIYPDLVEIGVDAVNSQLFCMDLERLAEVAKGRLTFWGEIDRQHVMTAVDAQVGREAVRRVARHLYDPAGGIIAQFEFGLAANPAVALAVYNEWEKVHAEATKAR